MAYDDELAERIRAAVAREPAVTEQRMFGGLAFLIGGHLAVSASGRGGMLLRCDPARTDELVGRPGVSRFVMRGRAMDGWLHVDPPDDDADLAAWVAVGVAYARSVPPKR